MSEEKRWLDKLNQIGSKEERQLLKRLRSEDPDLADAMYAKLVEAKLDDIGVEKVSTALHQNLYAIANAKPKKSVTQNRTFWTAWTSVAAVILVVVMAQPWRAQEPSADEITQARQQLAITFHYLNKAADIARQETENSIAFSVKTAFDSSPFIEAEPEKENRDL